MSEKENNSQQQHPSQHGMQGYPYYYYPYPYPAYNTRQFQQAPQPSPQFQQAQQAQQVQQSPGINLPGMLPLQQSYIENILRLNRGKVATFYMTFENNTQWNAEVFTGVIEAAGRDHIIISNPETGQRHLLLMIYLDYVTFDEEIAYDYPFGGGQQQLAGYSPR